MKAKIKGLGWVFASSMGHPGHIRQFPSSMQLPKLSGKSVLPVPYKPFGRMDNYSRMGFTAIAFAMAHAGFAPIRGKDDAKGDKRQIALIAGSQTGCLETDFLYQATLSRAGGTLPSPALFAYTLPSCFLGEAAIYFGLTGESYMMEEQTDTGLTALSTTMDCLESGLYPVVVCGVCNSVSTPEETSPACPGALFLVLEGGERHEEDRDSFITRDSRDSAQFLLGKRPIKTLIDLTQYHIDDTH